MTSLISRVRSSAVVVHNDKVLAFKAKDPHSGREFIFLPGGSVEPEETAVDAAVRETLEETGFQIQVDPMISVDREYLFHWNNQDYDCLTIFYRGRLLHPIAAEVKDAPYNLGVIWVPTEQVDAVFGYTTEIKTAIKELLG
jgi:8-oxo-dGTP pyrophosphatase MutT (NUDIX family)